MSEVAWISEAKKCLGQKEVAGPGFNAWIKNQWLSLPGGKWFWESTGSDDSLLAWCGMACAGIFQRCGIQIPKRYASARAWLEWGTKLSGPVAGAVVVFERGPKMGHVGIIGGRNQNGDLMVYGGNQGDEFKLAPFSDKLVADGGRVLGYRWPPGQPLPPLALMPVIASSGALSSNEA